MWVRLRDRDSEREGERMARTVQKRQLHAKKGKKERHKDKMKGGYHLGGEDGRRDGRGRWKKRRRDNSADQHFDCTFHPRPLRKEESKGLARKTGRICCFYIYCLFLIFVQMNLCYSRFYVWLHFSCDYRFFSYSILLAN